MLIQWRKKWEKGANVPNLSESARNQILGLLKRLVKLRWEWESMDKFLALLAIPKPIVTADMLLVVMFNTVRYGMHKPDWGEITGESMQTTDASALESDDDATRTYKETMELESTVTQVVDSCPKR
jgi:hypothetical protein